MDRPECDKIIDEIHRLLFEGSAPLGNEITRELVRYTVPFLKSDRGELLPAGTGTLVRFQGAPYILTAAHVWELNLAEADRIVIPLRDDGQNRYSISPNQITPVGPAAPPEWTEWGPDIRLLRLPPETIGGIEAAGRPFFNLSMKKERFIDCGFEFRMLAGAPALRGEFTAKRAFPELQGMLVRQVTGPFLSLVWHRSDFDYIDLDIDTSMPDVAPRFGGVSGGGLWKIFVYKGPDGRFESFKVLEGVAFFQMPQESGGLVVRCHGPQSIGKAVCYLLN
ncbi:MAG TPA: hypothetical protein VEJ67_18475 [Candidatus Cybelea sp.]|nr:hypothetical protein [Candidatus Cybelea sp.]